MSENDVTELSNKTHKTIQILSGLTVVVLGGLLYFGIFGAGIPLYLALGFVNIFLTIFFTDVFVQRDVWYQKLETVEREGFAASVPLICGVLAIVCAALGYVTSGAFLSFGIQLLLMGVFNLLRFLNESLSKSIETENNFLKLFYKTENTTLTISILNCLALGVMVLCGYCNLACAISLGAPLLGVSLILKLGVLLYDKWEKWEQAKNSVEFKNEEKGEESKDKDKNLDNNEKKNLGNNPISPQEGFDEQNEENNQGDPPGQTP